MTKDDPFGLENDAGRTRIRPVNRPRAAPTGGPMRQTAPSTEYGAGRLRQARAGDNALVSAFSVLLGLAPELERATAPENPDVLRARFLENLTYSRDSAVSQGIPLARADQGAWFVAALLDDVALNTPWGAHSGWPRQPLVTQISGDVDAGERFFVRLDELMRYPERDPELLELAFMCLSLGFRGRYRVQGATGEAAIAQLRSQVARVLVRPDDERADLSPHWKGVVADDQPPRFIVPIWSIAIIAAALIAAVYVGLGMRLSAKGEQLYTLTNILPPAERAAIFRPVIENAAPPPPLILEPVVLEFLPLVAEAAPPDRAGALTGREDASLAIVVLQASDPELFRSAKAEMNAEYDPLIASIARVIGENIEFVGGVTVVGHTDSVPVQRSNPFQSNQGLSEARAATIARALAAAGVPADLISSEGRAATQPIADNGTREGRARNRRVEIVIEKKV
jgi:type VI secretion system protein ImpK